MGFQIFKDETENRIILVDNIVYRFFCSLFFIAFGAFWVWYQIVSYYPNAGWEYFPSLFLRLFMILSGGALLFFGLRAILINESFIIDKKIQSVTFKRNSFIEYLRFIKEIPFSDIIAIAIVRTTRKSELRSTYDKWGVNISTKRESIPIYRANSKSDAESAAERFHKIIEKRISYYSEEI